jgi:hypothetical protein
MLRDFHVWDYTFPVLASPDRFAGGELFPGTLGRVAKQALEQAPRSALKALLPVVPTYLWVATKGPVRPKGPALPQPPERVQ